MDFEEAVALSEAEDLSLGTATTLANVKTPMFLLTFTGKKSEVNIVMSSLPPGGFIYWRHNKVGGKDVHRVILKDDTAATYARMFGQDNPVTRLTVGGLAEARNEIDVPWLPSNRNFLIDRAHDRELRIARQTINQAVWMLRNKGAEELGNALEDVSEQVKGMLRRPRPSEC